MSVCVNFLDVIGFGGDPYSESGHLLISMCMSSAEELVHDTNIDWSFKDLFPSLVMDAGEDNRMPEITLDDVWESTPWDFDFNFEDLINKLMYKIEEGIDYLGIVCPICRKNILEDAIIVLGEDDVHFCSECNVLLWLIER